MKLSILFACPPKDNGGEIIFPGTGCAVVQNAVGVTDTHATHMQGSEWEKYQGIT